jgi:hypothetical protein
MGDYQIRSIVPDVGKCEYRLRYPDGDIPEQYGTVVLRLLVELGRKFSHFGNDFWR